MLKITTRLEAESITLVVEGRVAGRWVKALQDCWNHIPEHRQRGALIDLTGASFIDQFGEELLQRLWQGGAELKAAGCLNNCLVDRIMASSRVDRPMLHRAKTNSRKEGMG